MKQYWWLSPGELTWAIFVRLALAGVFIPEGLQKLTHADILGAGRFVKIGIPWPEFFGPFVGVIEMLAGIMFLIGYASRAAAVPIIVIMTVAIISTKIPILLGRNWWIFSLRHLDRYGFLSFTHETRTDWDADGRNLHVAVRIRSLVARCARLATEIQPAECDSRW